MKIHALPLTIMGLGFAQAGAATVYRNENRPTIVQNLAPPHQWSETCPQRNYRGHAHIQGGCVHDRNDPIGAIGVLDASALLIIVDNALFS
jgi:hypothetical protein